jgi:TolA-binding protein
MTTKPLSAVPAALFSAVLLVATLGLAACERSYETDTAITETDPYAEPAEQELEIFRADFERRLENLDERIDRLQDVAEQPQHEQQVDQIALRRDHLEDRLQELEPVPGPAFERMRSDLQRELDNLEQEIARLEQQVVPGVEDPIMDPNAPGTTPYTTPETTPGTTPGA